MRAGERNGWMHARAHAWRVAGATACAGAALMLVGLLLGPTPGTDPVEALRRIDDTRAMYVATNAIDLLGVAVLGAGLFLVARLLATGVAGSLVASLGGVAVATGTALVAVVLVIQTVVDPGVAQRFVAASGADAATQLAVGRAFLDFETGLFGIGIMVEMAGIAGIASSLLRMSERGRAPHVDERVLAGGVVVAAVAGLTGIGFFVDALGWLERLEAVCSLATLVWVVAAGALLYHDARGPEPTSLDLNLSLRMR